MSRTREELQAISDAVLYELQMLFGTAQALREEVQGPIAGTLPWTLKMASIEAFAIHARVLEEFLWAKPKRGFPDDAHAADFFAVGEWEETRQRVQRTELDQLRDRAGHEVAHLSYRRLTSMPDTRPWKFDVIAGVIGNAFRLFVKNVDAELLSDGFEERLRASWPEYLNFPIAMSFPPNCRTSPAISVATESLHEVGQLHQATFAEMIPLDRP